MIESAIELEEKDKLGIEYHVLDASKLKGLKDNSFDIVTCFMALQDINCYKKAINEASRVLKKNGHFIFVIPHPCFEKKNIDGEFKDGWEFKPGSTDRKSENALFYMVDGYFDSGGYTIPWKMTRLLKHFETMSFHRTFTEYSEALCSAGLCIRRIVEPKPTKEGLEKYPEYFGKSLRIPDSIVFETIKI